MREIVAVLNSVWTARQDILRRKRFMGQQAFNYRVMASSIDRSLICRHGSFAEAAGNHCLAYSS